MMSNLTAGASTGSSSHRNRERFVAGIPKECWCGAAVDLKLSRSTNNPYRWYYRCVVAISEKLSGDKHVFKWADEVFGIEIERMSSRFERLEMNLTEQLRLENEKLQMKMDDEFKEKMDALLQESECKMKKVMAIGLVLGCMVCIGVIKLLD